MTDRTITVTLPCGCNSIVEVPIDTEVGVELVTCPDCEAAAPQLVTWRQIIAVTVAPLAVPAIEAEGDLITPNQRAVVAGNTVEDLRRATQEILTRPPGDAPSYHDPTRPLVAGDVLTSPMTADEWKANVKARDFSHALLLQQARELADRHKLEKPRTLDDIDEVLTPLVLEWLDATWPAKAATS